MSRTDLDRASEVPHIHLLCNRSTTVIGFCWFRGGCCLVHQVDAVRRPARDCQCSLLIGICGPDSLSGGETNDSGIGCIHFCHLLASLPERAAILSDAAHIW